MSRPDSRDGIESADPWGMVTDEIEEIAKKRKKSKDKR